MCQLSSVEGEVLSMTVGVAERSTVLLVSEDIVSEDIVSMLTGGYTLLRVCLIGGDIVSITLGVGVPGGGIVCTTLGVREGVKISSVVAEVTEDVGCSVCFVHALGGNR